MREFFRGWRRKAGVVTLLIAVGLSGIWLKTFLRDDYVAFSFSPHRTQLIYSSSEVICWCAWDAKYPLPFWYWESRADLRKLHDSKKPPAGFIMKVHWDSNHLNFDDVNYREWHLSYRMVVPSLALLSAYLILWKPRKRSPIASQSHA